MKTSDFDYDLPEKFVAQTPVEPRDHSKLLVYNRKTDTTEIKHFYDIVDYLERGDVLVINTTRVMPARLYGKKPGTQTKFEVLLLKKLPENSYEVLVKPMKRLKIGEKLTFDGGVVGELVSKNFQYGTAVMCFEGEVEKIGQVPLPHYIHANLSDPGRYQTVYNNCEGSVAAPTAGLHWTPKLIQKAKDKGVIFGEILLHVGLGTFRPVKVDDVADHVMHSEYYEIPASAAKAINDAKTQNRRVICVGTTAVRTLESVFKKHGRIVESCGETDIFIYPPYKFAVMDALVTNFHLPKSTLIMLVSAFVGREKILALYETAKTHDFRFFSFGDSCFLC